MLDDGCRATSSVIKGPLLMVEVIPHSGNSLKHLQSTIQRWNKNRTRSTIECKKFNEHKLLRLAELLWLTSGSWIVNFYYSTWFIINRPVKWNVDSPRFFPTDSKSHVFDVKILMNDEFNSGSEVQNQFPLHKYQRKCVKIDTSTINIVWAAGWAQREREILP